MYEFETEMWGKERGGLNGGMRGSGGGKLSQAVMWEAEWREAGKLGEMYEFETVT